MERKVKFICVAVGLLLFTGFTHAMPAPVWSSSLENDTDTTNGGGTIVNGPTSYVSGAVDNAFAGNGSVYAEWGNTAVATIFDGVWDNNAGWTVDLYFSGDHWSNHSGDSGLWSVTDRYGGDPDGYIIMSVRDGSLRFPLKDSYTGADATQYLTGVTLENNTVYHLIVQNIADQLTVTLNDSVVFDQNIGMVISFPEYNDGSISGGRYMNVGRRAVFGGTLQTGEWVDEINVYNGVPEPATMMLLGLGGLALIRKRKA